MRLGKLKALADAVSFPIYRWAVRREFFKFAAILASLTIFALNGRRETRLLFFDRSVFRLDLETMANVSDRVQYVGVQRKYFREVLNLYFRDLFNVLFYMILFISLISNLCVFACVSVNSA